MEIDDKEGVRALPGVLDLLAALPEGAWTVVTSATGALARVRLARRHPCVGTNYKCRRRCERKARSRAISCRGRAAGLSARLSAW